MSPDIHPHQITSASDYESDYEVTLNARGDVEMWVHRKQWRFFWDWREVRIGFYFSKDDFQLSLPFVCIMRNVWWQRTYSRNRADVIIYPDA